MSSICAVVPVKRFDIAKSRLAGILANEQRVALAEAMFRDVLRSLNESKSLSCVLVVTADPIATRIAIDFGARVVSDNSEHGTNAAILMGLEWVIDAAYEGALIVPADIPFVTSEEIELALQTMKIGRVVLTQAYQDGGTNLLGLLPATSIKCAFGADSFQRHYAAANAAGLIPTELSLTGAARDIDTPTDLETPPEIGMQTLTRALIASWKANP